MDEDEDDLYGNSGPQNGAKEQQDEETMKEEEDNEDGDAVDEDSDSDIDIITERKPGSVKPESTPAPARSETTLKPAEDTAQRTSASPRPSSTKPAARVSAPNSARPGTDFPAIKNTTVDPNAPLPSYTLQDGTTKPLIDLDFDADLAENTKPWRLPGTDQSDYFNYGFDEFSWATYCFKQKEMRDGIAQEANQKKMIEAMLGGPTAMPMGPQGGMPPIPPQGPAAMTGMPGMPPEMSPDMMNAMMQQMMASGMDPTQMDFNSFMQQMQGMQAGGGMPQQPMQNSGPPQNAPLGPGQHNDRQGGYGGQRNRGRRW